MSEIGAYDPALAERWAQPVAPANPATSPAYLAFLRALGLEDAMDETNKQLAVDSLNRRAGLTREDIRIQGERSQEGIAGSHEARGLFRSGERLKAQARQSEDTARQYGGLELDAAEQQDKLMADLALRRAERARELASKSYETSADLYSQGV